MALWLASSSTWVVRSDATRATPGNWPSAATKRGGKYAVSAAEVPSDVRTYRSAGSTTSSHCVTESRKLATITVNATARLSDATTPLTATAALSRTRRARSTASMHSRWSATSVRNDQPPRDRATLPDSGAPRDICGVAAGLPSRSYSSDTPHGRAVMPPTSSSATDR